MSFLQEYRNRPRRVVFYGRVSTEHEAQVSALDNQMDWYQELAAKNPNWEVVGQYVDEGITGTQVYGFECYRHKKQSALYLKKHGLPAGICELKAFPEWKLELMARKIFETVWGNRREAVLEACRMLSACYREESADPDKLKALDKRIDALNQRLDNLIMMKASNQITLSQFVEQSNEIGVQQQRVNKEKAELLAKQGDHKALDMDAIEASLCEAVDFTDGMVSEWFIQNFVRRITPIDDTRFAWVLDLAPEPQTLVCEVNGRKEYPRITLESNLYRGAWPKVKAKPSFLIGKNGKANGDISLFDFAQDRLPSRTPGSNLFFGREFGKMQTFCKTCCNDMI